MSVEAPRTQLESEITEAHELYKVAQARDERAAHRNAEAKRELFATSAHVDYLLDRYFETYVKPPEFTD